MMLSEQIGTAAHQVLEKTPPELAGDIFRNGVVLTGGGAQLHGLPEYLSQELKVNVEVSPDPVNCVGAGHGYEPERARPAGDRLYGCDPPHRPPLSEKTYFTVWKKLRYFLFIVVESGRKILYNIFKSVFAGGAMRFGRRRIND